MEKQLLAGVGQNVRQTIRSVLRKPAMQLEMREAQLLSEFLCIAIRAHEKTKPFNHDFFDEKQNIVSHQFQVGN